MTPLLHKDSVSRLYEAVSRFRDSEKKRKITTTIHDTSIEEAENEVDILIPDPNRVHTKESSHKLDAEEAWYFLSTSSKNTKPKKTAPSRAMSSTLSGSVGGGNSAMKSMCKGMQT